MAQRPPRPTPEQVREQRQQASDALCRMLGLEPFELDADLDADLEIPSRFDPMTWPAWRARAMRAVAVVEQRGRYVRRPSRVDFNPFEAAQGFRSW